MIITVVIWSLMYVVFIVLLHNGWRAASRQRVDSTPVTKLSTISVLIPARNEEKNIASILNDLSVQDYPLFEAIVINDHSEDRTVELARRFEPFAQVINCEGTGKKQALTLGVSHAKGDVIVTTDADCTLTSQWLKSVNTYFQQPELQMLVGPVTIRNNSSFFTQLQQIEFASLIGSGAATLLIGYPVLCNGANLAFRKRAFEAVGGYEGNLHVASGDDEFLMRKIHSKFRNSIKFMAQPEGIVHTGAQPDLKSLFQQRLRWASKWRNNNSVAALLMAFFIAAVQVVTLACFFQFAVTRQILWLIFPVIKMALNAFLLIRFSRFLKIPWSWPAFFTLELLYPVYVLLTAIAATFGNYQWKGRKY